MSLLSWFADRVVLSPSTKPIETELRSEVIETPFGEMECWVCDSSGEMTPNFIAVKFPGAGGRAERSSPHPFELWADKQVETWTINHHGYGNSTGNASLRKFGRSCDAVWNHLQNEYPNSCFLVVGNSLGCVSALYLASRYPVDGLFLRNPVPLQQMISQRPKYNRWSLGIAKQVARNLPTELDAVANADQCNCPAVFIQSECDRVVPVEYQQQIWASYRGAKHLFVIEGADHHHKIPVHQEAMYLEAVAWLKDAIA